MPSPFPGMDPYLEAPDRWGGVHGALIFTLREMLTRQVAPRFFVDSEDSVYILAPDDPGRRLARPDIFVSETTSTAAGRPDQGRITAPLVLERPQPIEVRYPRLEVRDTRERRVVATVEVLSPVNKAPGSIGQTEFLRKRTRVMESSAHWIEIDLLRAGARPLEVEGHGDYYALLHRADAGDRLEGWFAGLRDRLPTIAVPLLDDLPDVPLDLQEAIEMMYGRYRYDAGLDYDVPPPAPPLSASDAAWAAECIQQWQVARAG